MDIERQNFLPEIEEQNKKFKAFKTEFETLLMKNYGLAINDCTDEQSLRVEFETGATVQEYIEFIADKHDLTNINPNRLFH